MSRLLTAIDSWIIKKSIQYFSIDLRSLAVFRIGLACVILLDLYLRSLDLSLFYTDDGVMPRSLLFKAFPDPWRFSIYLLSGTTTFTVILFVLQAFLALLLLIGWRTRWVLFFSWFMMVSLHVRNPMINDSGDQLLRLLLFWSLFLPLGASFSVDSALNTRSKSSYSILSVGSAALLLQVCLMYWWTGYLKSKTVEWQNGDSIFLALNITGYTQPIASFLQTIDKDILSALTKATLYFELAGPFLFFSPICFLFFRGMGIVLFWLMHLSFGLILQLGVFPFFDFVAIIPFIPTAFWEKVFSRWRTPERLGFQIEARGISENRWKALRLAKTFLLIPETKMELTANSSPGIVRTIDWTGKVEEGRNVWREIIKHSPILGWAAPMLSLFLRIKAFPALVKALLKPTLNLAHFNSEKIRISFAGNLLAGLFLIYVIFWNMWNSTDLFKMPQFLVPSGLLTYVEQRWGMYAPPSKFHCWLVAHAKLKNGEEIDVLNPGRPRAINYSRPYPADVLYRTVRYKLYLMQLPQAQFKDQSGYLTWYLCREWNKTHYGNEKMKEVTLNIVYQYFFPEVKAPWTVGLWYQLCG